MLNNPTIEKLKDLKLKVMAEMLTEPGNELRELSFEERLGLMVERQRQAKKNTKVKRLLGSAKLPIDACIEDIDYCADRVINKKTIQTLSTCTYIEQKLNVVLSGRTGSGKTYISYALGNCACRNEYRVSYFRIPELLLEIQDAKNQNRFLKFIACLENIRLLILDDIGLKSYTLEESRDILEIAEAIYNKSSTILSAQIDHSKWYDLFADPTIADAIMDRFIHNSYILPLDSKISMRQVMAEKTKQDLTSNHEK